MELESKAVRERKALELENPAILVGAPQKGGHTPKSDDEFVELLTNVGFGARFHRLLKVVTEKMPWSVDNLDQGEHMMDRHGAWIGAIKQYGWLLLKSQPSLFVLLVQSREIRADRHCRSV
jgi:hypothetical protein